MASVEVLCLPTPRPTPQARLHTLVTAGTYLPSFLAPALSPCVASMRPSGSPPAIGGDATALADISTLRVANGDDDGSSPRSRIEEDFAMGGSPTSAIPVASQSPFRQNRRVDPCSRSFRASTLWMHAPTWIPTRLEHTRSRNHQRRASFHQVPPTH